MLLFCTDIEYANMLCTYMNIYDVIKHSETLLFFCCFVQISKYRVKPYLINIWCHSLGKIFSTKNRGFVRKGVPNGSLPMTGVWIKLAAVTRAPWRGIFFGNYFFLFWGLFFSFCFCLCCFCFRFCFSFWCFYFWCFYFWCFCFWCFCFCCFCFWCFCFCCFCFWCFCFCCFCFGFCLCFCFCFCLCFCFCYLLLIWCFLAPVLHWSFFFVSTSISQ